MLDELLQPYEEELGALRRLGAEFASAYPSIAARLRISGEVVDDPHVERLIEAVAFLNARIRRRLDDEFPELVDTLLGVLQPQLLAPIPSLCLVRMTPTADMAGAAEIQAGAEIELDLGPGEVWRYRTCYPVTLQPIRLSEARLALRPYEAPASPRAGGAVAVLRLTLACLAEGMSFAKLGVRDLRLWLAGPQARALQLYELLLNDALEVTLATGVDDPEPLHLGPGALQPVGFRREEALIPDDPRSFPGYRLLSEYFALPEKFLAVDLNGLAKAGEAGRLELFIHLRRLPAGLERRLDAQAFALHCTPAINLFPQPAEPMRIDHGRAEQRVVPDARRAQALEVFAVRTASAVLPDGRRQELRPFFAPQRPDGPPAPAAFWHAARRAVPGGDGAGELYLSTTDHEARPGLPDGSELSLETLCLNRNLPPQLVRDGAGLRLRLTPARGQVARLDCMVGPTPVLRWKERRGGRPRLLAQLSLSHLSLADGEAGAASLRGLLRLHDRKDTAETRSVIDSVRSLAGTPATARAPVPDLAAFCRGLDLTLELAGKAFADSSPFLLMSVLERFLALHANVNAFTRLTARLDGEAQPMRRWPARAGELPLL